MSIRDLKGSIVALVTPFTAEGSIDYIGLKRLVRYHLDNGTDGIILSGTTGESPTLTLEELATMISFVKNEVAGQIPVISGAGSNYAPKSIAISQMAEDEGADGLLISSPYYNKPTQTGIYNYFQDICQHTDLPIIMYNVPGRTASNMTTDLTLSLANDFPQIVGVKEASGYMDQIMDILHRRAQGFNVYSGDDALAFPLACLGGEGCISVVANQIPREFSNMLHLAMNGRVEEAREIHYRFLNLMNLNFIESNPIPVKTSLSLMGFIDNNYRSPLGLLESMDHLEQLRAELDELGLLVKTGVLQ